MPDRSRPPSRAAEALRRRNLRLAWLLGVLVILLYIASIVLRILVR